MVYTGSPKLIAVVGATGSQGGSVARALRDGGRFRVRALTRHPDQHAGIADEVVEADLNRPESLPAALDGAHGVFAMTNFWEPGGVGEVAQGEAVVRAAKRAGVRHFVWSTLPNVEQISGGAFHVPHFTDKSKVDAAVAAAGFEHHTFVVPPFYYQNLLTNLVPQARPDGSTGWTLPIDPAARRIHAGDITELGAIVAGAFSQPDLAGSGAYLPLVGDLLSFDDIVATVNGQGHRHTFERVPADVFAGFFPGAGELAEMFGYFEKHSYLGGAWEDRIALANRVAGRRPTNFATWAQANMAAAHA